MNKRSPSVPLDISLEELKNVFAEHPVLKRIEEQKLVIFKDFLTTTYKSAVQENLILTHPTTNEVIKEDKPLLTQEEWVSLRNSNVLDDMCLFRYLYHVLFGTGEVKINIYYLLDMLRWRKSFKPEEIRLKPLEKVAKSGFVYHSGHDKRNRPLLYLLIAKDMTEHTPENIDLKFKTMVYEFERCIKFMEDNCPPEVYQVVWVVQAYNATINLDLVRSMKRFFDELEARYPERTGQILVLNPPWTINVIWPFLKPFLTQEQQDRYVFISGWYDSDIRDALLKHIDENQLAKELYDGKHPFLYDFKALVSQQEGIK
jgi:hypothetical protein